MTLLQKKTATGWIATLICLTLAGCEARQDEQQSASEPPRIAAPPAMEAVPPPVTASPVPTTLTEEDQYHTVTIFYGTDRNRTTSENLNKYFGDERASVSYGEIEVSIPFNHKVGRIESPSIWRLEFSENPEKHISLLALTPLKKERFLSSIKDRVKASGNRSAFIFFHGYNVKFSAAAKRTAQMAHDLKFPGVPIFYSWPAVGRVTAYTKDEGNIQWSQAHIKAFLDDVAKRADLENIYVIAHSMGNRGLTRALADLINEQPALKSKFKEVILAAPDIDAAVFKRDILPRLTKHLPVTLYASSDDKALLASKKVHGYPRAGDTGDMIVIADGLETIDATGLDTGFLRHSYFSETQPMLKDIKQLALDNLPASQRPLLIPVEGKRHWVFKPEK